MSYILDALRKADAERERDPGRGIHAQPAAGLPAPARSGVPRWTIAAAVIAGVAVASYAMLGRDSPPADASVARLAAPVAPAAAITVIPAPAPAVVPVAVAVVPAAPVGMPAKLKAQAERSAARPAAVVVATAAPSAVLKAPAPQPAASAALAAPPPPDRILAMTELPAEVQRELPKLAISGGVHSENASQRMLIVGGQVMAEGAELAPGVVLEQIRAKSAVLRFRGFRYSVAY
jgi:general secretion pathway protein B